MSNSLVARAAVLLLVCSVTVSLMGVDVASAMVSGGPGLRINGRVSGSGVVVAGDKVENGDATHAMITLTGATIDVAPHTAMTFDPNQLSVAAGAITVNTEKKMKTSYYGLTVETTGTSTRFVVGDSKSKYVIAALRNSLLVSDGNSTVELHQGEALVQERTPEPAAKGTGTSKGTQPGTEQRGGKAGNGKSLPGWVQITIIGGTIGGVLGGLGLAGTFDSKKTLSTSHP